MHLVFLGTSSGIPTRQRGLAAVALELAERRETWLFDCGEGTLHAFMAGRASLARLRRIFITHLHGDHIYGLMGILSSRNMLQLQSPIDVYGPAPLAEYLRGCVRTTMTGFGYPFEVHELQPGDVVQASDHRVACLALTHRVPTLGYRVEEPARPGRFELDRAAALGVPAGPLFGRLQQGQDVTLDDGRLIRSAEVVGPSRPGRVVALCTDTTYCQSAVTLARDADLLIHEATYAQCHHELAVGRLHATAAMAATVARQAAARQLWLTHFSPRYETGQPVGVDELVAEARAIFPATHAAADGLRLPIPRREGCAEGADQRT